jgi:DNA polymerase-1
MQQTTYRRLILDGNNFLFRAFYTDYNKAIGREKDESVIRHFMKMLKGVVERFQPEETFFTWDKKLNEDSHNFRNDLTDYKGQRQLTSEVEQVLSLHQFIQEILDAMGIKTIYPYNLEADDVIYFLSKLEDGRNVIVSQDKDLLQLVSPNTDLLLASKNLLVNVQNFQMNANVEQEKFILYKCILGDTSDNIRGLDKFGPVKSKKLAEDLYEKGVFCSADDTDGYLTDDQWNIIERNMKLMDLSYAASVYPEETTKYEEQMKIERLFDADTLRYLFQRYNLVACIRNFGDYNRLFNKNKLTTDDLDSVLNNLNL